MGDIALWGTFEVLPGKDQEAENFFAETSEVVESEPGTTSFYAVKIEPGKYGSFQTYTDEAAIEAHQTGAAGKDAFRRAVGVTFAALPEITRSTVLQHRNPLDAE